MVRHPSRASKASESEPLLAAPVAGGRMAPSLTRSSTPSYLSAPSPASIPASSVNLGPSDDVFGSSVPTQSTGKGWRAYYRHETRAMLWLAGPVAFNTFSRFIVYSIDSAFLGRLGTDQLAGATLAESFFTMTLVIIIGCASALSTFASQSFGAENYTMLGLWLQVSLVALTLISIPVIIFNIFSGKIAALIEHDQNILKFASTFGTYISIMTLPICWFAALRQFFQAQNIVLPGTIVAVCAIPLNVGFNQLFIYGVGSWKGLGFVGSPIASTMTATVQLLLYYLYCFKYKKLHLKCWDGFTWEALKPARIKTFLGLALPMGLTMAFDESIFQALVLFSTRLPATDLAALGIMYQWYNIVFSLWWGIGLATQIRVAFNLGANNPEAARCSFYVGMSWGLLLGCLFSGLVLLNIDRMGNLFSSDPAVRERVAKLAPALAVDAILFVASSTLGSTMDGMGKVVMLFVATLFCAYGITLPVAYTTAFDAGWGAEGLWWGPSFGDAARCIILVIVFVFSVNWQKEAKKAVVRVEAGVE